MQNPCFEKSLLATLVFAFMALMLFVQCDQHQKITGKYQSQEGKLQVTLELEANGKGLWAVETDNAPFRWDLHQNKIRLHTRSGGVIEGTIHNETIQIALPGMGDIRFKRIHSR